MRSPGGLQLGGVERLRAEADPRDPAVPERPQSGPIHSRGVGFDRDLGVGGHSKPSAAGAKDGEQLLGRQRGRRAPAEIHRLDPAAADEPRVAGQLDFLEQVRHKRHGPIVPVVTGHKRAEPAPPLAERDVEIQPDAVLP